MAFDFTRPTPARRDALFHSEGRSEAHGEPAVSDTLKV